MTMEVFLSGRDAVSTCLKVRPLALREVFVDGNRARSFEDLREIVFQEKREWNIVSNAELTRLAGTSLTDGIVARTERPEPAQIRPVMRDEWAAAGEKVIFLEAITDVSQLVSILRVAVICGVTRLVVDEKSIPAVTCSRVWSLSGGAAEHLKIYRTESMAGMLRMMGEKFFIVGLVREGGRRIDYSTPLAFPGKTVSLFLSGDKNGVPSEMISRCSYLLHIPEPVGVPVHYSPAELASLVLPWMSSKVKRPGVGFFERKKLKKK